MTGAILGAAMYVAGILNQTNTVNGATLLWAAGIVITVTSLRRRNRAHT